MLRNTDKKTERIIDLYEIVKLIDAELHTAQSTQKINDVGVAKLSELKSKIITLDKEIVTFFTTLPTTFPNEAVKKDTAEKLQNEYRAYRIKLERLADEVNTDANLLSTENSVVNKDVFTNIAFDLDKIREFVPTVTENSFDNSETLTLLGEALGGISISYGQSMLPTTGAVEIEEPDSVSGKKNGKKRYTAFKGICAGIVCKWAEQSVTGTQQYPVTSSLAVIGNQSNYHELLDRKYNTDPTKYVTLDTNLVKKLDDMHKSIPHMIAIYDADETMGHAIGIRKNGASKIVEIAEPNPGYFFFPDSEAGGAWLASLLQSYRTDTVATGNPPRQVETFPGHHAYFNYYIGFDESQPIPENPELKKHDMDKYAALPFTEAGYNKLLINFKRHLDSIVKGRMENLDDTSDTVLELVLDGFKYMAVYLSIEDNQNVIDYLQSCLDWKESTAKHHFLHKDCRDHINKIIKDNKNTDATKNKIKATLALVKLTKEKKENENKTLEKQLLLNAVDRVKKYEKDLIARAYQLAIEKQELVDKLKKNKEEKQADIKLSDASRKEVEDKINDLNIKIDLYGKWREKLRARNIDGKLLASNAEKLSKPYTLSHAKDELKDSDLYHFSQAKENGIPDQLVQLVKQVQHVIYSLDTYHASLHPASKHPASLAQQKNVISNHFEYREIFGASYRSDLLADCDDLAQTIALKKNNAKRKLIAGWINKAEAILHDIHEGATYTSAHKGLNELIPGFSGLTDIAGKNIDESCEELAEQLGKHCVKSADAQETNQYTKVQIQSLEKCFGFFSLKSGNAESFIRILMDKLNDNDLDETDILTIKALLKQAADIRKLFINGAASEEIFTAIRTIAPSYEEFRDTVDFKSDLNNHILRARANKPVLQSSNAAVQSEQNDANRDNLAVPAQEAVAQAVAQAAAPAAPQAQPDQNTEDMKLLVNILKEMINDHVYWSQKTSLMLREAPKGIRQMREYLQNPGLASDRDILNNLAEICSKRPNLRKREGFASSFFSLQLSRSTETYALYVLCIRVKQNLDANLPITTNCANHIKCLRQDYRNFHGGIPRRNAP